MSKDAIPVTVKILDKEYKISCPAGEHEALVGSAKRVNDSMQKIRDGGKALGAERIAVMAAINITHELSDGAAKADPSIVNRLEALQQSVDAALTSLAS